MKVAIAGASGLIGAALSKHFEKNGHTVLPFVRKGTTSKSEIYWNPTRREIETKKLEGLDAVINLAGKNIGKHSWDDATKLEFFSSRISGTRLLALTISELKNPPKVFINASAVGYYGSNSPQPTDESAANGSGYLAWLCDEWEKGTKKAKNSTRVIHARFGAIISPKGGMLQKMMLPFRLGLGAKIGSGNQFISWVGLSDAVAALEFIINENSLSGPVNITAPNPVTNKEFTKILARKLKRPAFFIIPAAIVKLIWGEMGEELMLSTTNAVPKKLLAAGYKFKCENLAQALE